MQPVPRAGLPRKGAWPSSGCFFYPKRLLNTIPIPSLPELPCLPCTLTGVGGQGQEVSAPAVGGEEALGPVLSGSLLPPMLTPAPLGVDLHSRTS